MNNPRKNKYPKEISTIEQTHIVKINTLIPQKAALFRDAENECHIKSVTKKVPIIPNSTSI